MTPVKTQLFSYIELWIILAHSSDLTAPPWIPKDPCPLSEKVLLSPPSHHTSSTS